MNVQLDKKIRFIITVPDGTPEEATPFQGFSYSLCRNINFIRFIQSIPTDIFELTPEHLPHRISSRISGLAPISWYAQSPRTLKSYRIPLESSFTVVIIDESENQSDYIEWINNCPGFVTLVAKTGGHIDYSNLSLQSIQNRFLEICSLLRSLGTVEFVDSAEAAITSWKLPQERELSHSIGGHGTITPNAAALRACGFMRVGAEPFSRSLEGEKAHIEQIVLTTNAVFDVRQENPAAYINQIYPRTPDLNLYLPATYDLKTAFRLPSDFDRKKKREIQTVLKVIEKQNSYMFELSSKQQFETVAGATPSMLQAGIDIKPHPIINIRSREIWLGTEAISCLSSSEISAVVRLPNRLNRTRGIVRQFAQHYRADKPQIQKRSEVFRNVQRAIADSFPTDFYSLIDRSEDGIRIIGDAHLEWLDVRGIPLGLRYNVARIPVTPGNAFINTLFTRPNIELTPEDFQDILVVSGLDDTDIIARQFEIAFEAFDQHWRDKIRINFVRVASRQELIAAINAFEGVLMVFDGHGSHKSGQNGYLWVGEEAVNVWSLRDEIHRPPPIVILSACDTHAADRNHATVANGFLALGCRSVLGSVFPLHASDAAIFTARLLYRVSDYIPAAIRMFKRSLTWLEVVSGMLRRQLTTDILLHLKNKKTITDEYFTKNIMRFHGIVDLNIDDPFFKIRQNIIDEGISEKIIDREIHAAIASSSTISYVHIGRPETILINSKDIVNEILSQMET